MSVIYGVVSTLVNLCNAYDKQEIIPEMLGNYSFFKGAPYKNDNLRIYSFHSFDFIISVLFNG